MNFLRNEPFEYNGHTVTLYELSALQRIEHLKYLAHPDNQLPTETDEKEMMSQMVAYDIRAGALLVAMSLWQADTTQSIDDLHHQVLSGWPVEMIGAADLFVKHLSDMIPKSESENDSVNDGEGEVIAEGADSAEKSSPVS